jgi:hypothetical protein
MNQHSWAFNGICDNCGIEQWDIWRKCAPIECSATPGAYMLKQSGDGFKASAEPRPGLVKTSYTQAEIDAVRLESWQSGVRVGRIMEKYDVPGLEDVVSAYKPLYGKALVDLYEQFLPKAGQPAAAPMIFDDFAVVPACLQPQRAEPPAPPVNLVALYREKLEIMKGQRCPHCKLKWAVDGSNVDCCEAMKAEIKKIEVEFWGRPVAMDDMVAIYSKPFALHDKLVGPPVTVTDDEVKPDAIVG